MDKKIQDIIACKRIADVGASRRGNKFGNSAAKEFTARGYETYLVHPEAEHINREPCYRNLAALPERVDAVLLSVHSENAHSILREAADPGLSKIWLQQGAESKEVLALAQDLGIDPVSKKCILMYAPPVRSFHSWQRTIVKLFGKL